MKAVCATWRCRSVTWRPGPGARYKIDICVPDTRATTLKMAYRATLQHYRDLIHRSLNGHCMYRVGNASDHLLAHRLVQHGHVHGSKPSITSYVKCVWQHFNETSCACKLRTWGQRVNDQLNVIAVLFGKQCNAIAAQRVRRGGQILSLHCKLYGKRTFKHVVEKYTHTGANYTTVKPLSFLLGAMLFSWEKEKICVADVKMYVYCRVPTVSNSYLL